MENIFVNIKINKRLKQQTCKNESEIIETFFLRIKK